MWMLVRLLDVVPQIPYQWSPVFLAPGIGAEDNFFFFLSRTGGGGGFRMIQVHYTCYALSFFYYYINSTSHQTLDPQRFETPALNYSHFSELFIFFSVQHGWFPLLCLSDNQSVLLYHHLISPLIPSSMFSIWVIELQLWFLSIFSVSEALIVGIHSYSRFGEHLYYYYLQFFIRWFISISVSHFLRVSCSFIWIILIWPNSLYLFLCVRWAHYISWSWRSGLM